MREAGFGTGAGIQLLQSSCVMLDCLILLSEAASLPGSVFFTQTAKCRENFLASAIRLEIYPKINVLCNRGMDITDAQQTPLVITEVQRDGSAVSNAAQRLKTGCRNVGFQSTK